MRILFTVENYYPRMSGVPVVVKYLAENLCKNGHEVTVATMGISNLPKEDRINKVHVKRFDIFYNRLKQPKGDINEYIKFVTEFNADVIVFECSQCMTTDLILPNLEKIQAIKIFHSHGFSGLTLAPFKKNVDSLGFLKNLYNFLKWKIYYSQFFKKYVKQFDLCLCLSEVDSSIEYLKKYNNNVRILSNAADDIFFNSELQRVCENPLLKYTTLNNERYCLSIANYFDYKNQIGILHEFYKTEISNMDMVFIGSEVNEYYEKLQKENMILKQKYPSKKVHLLYGINREDIPTIMGHATLYLVGSHFEEFSISLIESMAMGVPFISTNVGNAKLLPGGITLNNIEQMRYKIKEILMDEHLYQDLSLKGNQYVNNLCRIGQVTQDLEEYIYHLCERNRDRC